MTISAITVLGWIAIFCIHHHPAVAFVPQIVGTSRCHQLVSSPKSTSTLFAATEHAEQRGGDRNDTDAPQSQRGEYSVRDCKYSDLGTVANIIIASFYADKVGWKSLYRLAELNRLQTSFAYPDQYDDHRMLVAVTKPDDGDEEDVVVGFCDIDARPCKTTPPLPRPYLSDLSVSPDHRRQGIAQSLVKASEDFLQSTNPIRGDIYIRVQESNMAAAKMYEKLEYDVVEKQDDADLGSVLVLYKVLGEGGDGADRRRNGDSGVLGIVDSATDAGATNGENATAKDDDGSGDTSSTQPTTEEDKEKTESVPESDEYYLDYVEP